MRSSLLRDTSFRGHFFTQFLGAFNDNFFKNILVLLITYNNAEFWGLNSKSLVALAGGIFILPYFLFSGTAGQLADRLEKSKLIRWTKVSELLIMLVATYGIYAESFPFLMIVLFLLGAQSAIFGPLKYGILPFLLETQQLTRGNALIAGSTFVAILVGTLLGGLLVLWDQQGHLTVGLFLLISLLGLWASFQINSVPSANEKIRPDPLLFRSTFHIVKRVYQERRIFKLLLVNAWFWFLGAGILSLIPPLVKNVYSGDEGVATLFLCLFTFGMGTGAYLAEKWSHTAGGLEQTGLIPPAGLGLGLCILGMGFTGYNWNIHPFLLMGVGEFLQFPKAWMASGFLFLMTLFAGLYIVPSITHLQRLAPREEVSQFIAANNIISSLAMIFSAVFIMFLYSLGAEIVDVLLIFGSMAVIASFFVYLFFSETAIHFLMGLLGRLFYQIEVTGRENLKGLPLAKNPHIIAANHQSFIDWLIILAVVPRPVRFIIDHKYYFFPSGPFWLSQAKLIPIATKREDPEILSMAFERIKTSVSEGAMIGIFPEGMITRTGEVRKLQPGLKNLVEEYQAHVIPIVIENLWGGLLSYKGGRIFSRESIKSLKWRRKVKVKILAPIHPESFSLSGLRGLIDPHSNS